MKGSYANLGDLPSADKGAVGLFHVPQRYLVGKLNRAQSSQKQVLK